MDIEMCYKYFVFLNEECDRYLRDKRIEEEEIANLKIEFDRFINEALRSDLPEELNSKISELKLNYTFHTHRDEINLFIRLIFGRWFQRNREREHKEIIDKLKYQIKGIPMFIRLNY